MRSFNSSNMADDNLHTSQSNLQQQQQRAADLSREQRADSLQELNEELAASQAAGAHQRPATSGSRGALSEMQPDLQYLAHEAPLDGGESTFGGAYSALGQRPAGQQETVSHSTHTYSSTITATRPHQQDQENDYERADFRLDQDELNGDSGGQLRADSAAAIRQASSEALEQLAPDNVDIQRPLQQAGLLLDLAPLVGLEDGAASGQQQASDSSGREHQVGGDEQETRGELEALQVEEPAAPIVVVESAATSSVAVAAAAASDAHTRPDVSRTARSSTRPLRPFLVSFMVDARGGAMRGCRHSGVRVIIPPGAAQQPMRITCRYLRRERLVHPPPLMEGEACASKIMEVGPAGAKFLGPVLIEVPHFASLRGREREIIILRSDSGEVWREHLVEADERLVADIIRAAELAEREHSAYQSDQENATPRPSSAFGAGGPDDPFASSNTDANSAAGGEPKQQQERRITRIVTNEFPQYFAIISRIRQEVHTVGPEGSAVDSQAVPKVQAIFTEGALTKRIKIGLQKKTTQNQKEAQSPDPEDGERTPRARSPTHAGSPAPSGSRPSSAAAKRRSRFLACFGASHGSQEPLGSAEQSATDGELASGSSANSSAAGDSPRQLANEKRVERRHIVEDVSDSEREDSSSLGARAGPKSAARNRKSSQLVPDDYYLEPESPLILNLSPKTYGKRMASSAAQTDAAKLERLSNSTRHEAKRRGLLGGRRRGRSKTQMTLPLHEPTSKQQAEAEAEAQAETPAADSSLESALSEQPHSIGKQIKSFLRHQPAPDAELKCLTRTIQTDSDSVTVQYVTIYGASGAAEAVEAAANSAASQKAAGQDDGYVSGSGELKRQEQQSRAKGLFSPFCVGSKRQEVDESSINDDDDAALKVNAAGQLDVQPAAKSKAKAKPKAKKAKEKKSQEKPAELERAKSEGSSERLEIVLEAKTPELASTAAESASGASSPTLQAAASPELPSGAEDADESLLTSRSISPTAGAKESKAKLKAEKAEKARRDKLERQRRKGLEEAQAKAEKARKRLEKEAKKKADKELKAQAKGAESGQQTVDESSGSQELAQEQNKPNKKEGFSIGATIAKTIQSVKFAPSPTKSAEVGEEQPQQQAAVDLAQDKATKAEPEAADGGESAGDKAQVSPGKLTKQVIDSMSSKFKVKLPKLGASREAPQAEQQADESMVHMSIGESSLPARDVSFEDEQQLERRASQSAEPGALPPAAPKALKPILKQQSTTSERSTASAAEISIGEPVKSLSSIANELVSEATEEAVRAADELARRAAAAASESPISSPASEISESKRELAKRAKAEREQAKKEAKLRALEEKRVARELEQLVKKAEEAAKRAEREAKGAAQQFAEQAEKQAKIAKAEAERAVLECELADITAAVVAESSPAQSEPSDSSGKRAAKSAQADAKRAAKEAKEEARRRAKEAEAEAKQKAREAKEEAKRLAKEAKQRLKLEAKEAKVEAESALPSAPSIELADVSSSESKSEEPTLSEPQQSPRTPTHEQQIEARSAPEVVREIEAQAIAELDLAASSEQVQEQPELEEGADEESPSKSKSRGGSGIKLPAFSLPKFKGTKKADASDEQAAAAKSSPDDEKAEEKVPEQQLESISEAKEESKAKKVKKSKKAKRPRAGKSGSSESLESSSKASAEPPSKSSLFSRLFRSKRKPKLEEASGEQKQDEAPAKSASEPAERAAPESGLIVSEMYPSDPNNADGEMILEVNVPENMISPQQQQQQRVKEEADGGQFASTLMSSSVTAGEQLDDQEATLVNMSQMADETEGDDDEATENVLSQATNDFMDSAGEQRRTGEQEQREDESPARAGFTSEVVESMQPLEAEELTEEQQQQQQQQVAAISTDQPQAPEAPHEGAAELKSEKGRKQLEAKLEKEAKKRAAEEQKLRKKQEKEAKKLAEAEARRAVKEERQRVKREAKEAKRLAELAKKEAKKNKGSKKTAPAQETETKSEAEPRDAEPRMVTSTVVLSSSTESERPAGEEFDEATGGRVLMSATSGQVPVSEETEVERIVEEVLGDDGTVTKRTKVVETKYVTLRQEEVRAVERRDIPVEEWERQQAAERRASAEPSTSAAGPPVRVERSPIVAESGELDEIRAVPSYFDPDSLPAEIKAETAPKKLAQKRAKLNQRLIKRAFKLARSEAKRAKVNQKKAEAEICVCDEAARVARKELKRAVKEAKRAAKEVAKQHKKMDKTDKKLAKQAKKLDKRQKKIDKELAKAEKRAEKKREKEAKKAAKQAGKRSASRSSSRSSRRSIKAEDISEPVLRSSSRLSIGRQQSIEPAVGELPQALDEAGNEQQVDSTLHESQQPQQRPTQEQIEQMVRDGEQVIVHTITKTLVSETDGEPVVIETSERVLTGREAEEAALRMELEAAREEEEEEEIDVVGLCAQEPAGEPADDHQENQTPTSTPDISQASAGSGAGKSKKNKKKRNKKQKSKESAD